MCDIITTIQDAIHQIEEDYHVKVIYAIECGSRLWGFSAANSDYDVRFVYVKPKEEYLRLDPFPDVIHRKVNKILDLDGWDLQKMLRLLSLSGINLQSFIVRHPSGREFLVRFLDIFKLLRDFNIICIWQREIAVGS